MVAITYASRGIIAITFVNCGVIAIAFVKSSSRFLETEAEDRGGRPWKVNVVGRRSACTILCVEREVACIKKWRECY